MEVWFVLPMNLFFDQYFHHTINEYQVLKNYEYLFVAGSYDLLYLIELRGICSLRILLDDLEDHRDRVLCVN